MAEPADIEEWFDGGTRLFVELPDSGRLASVFARREGEGPWLTCLHGFPTCSWDFHRLVPALAGEYRLLVFDFLGFGDSDKPRGHDYRIAEQADVAEAVWAHYGVERTGLVAHDYGATVAQELLAREREAGLSVGLDGCVLLNAGLYPDAGDPLRIQGLLRTPVVGALLAQVVTRGLFGRSFRQLFAEGREPDDDELDDHWAGITRRGGRGIAHRLVAYMDERETKVGRWQGAVETTEVPCRFVWGMADPVSGAPVAERVRERVPGADLVALEDVGHYPHLEVPERVADEVAGFFADRTGDAPSANGGAAGE